MWGFYYFRRTIEGFARGGKAVITCKLEFAFQERFASRLSWRRIAAAWNSGSCYQTSSGISEPTRLLKGSAESQDHNLRSRHTILDSSGNMEPPFSADPQRNRCIANGGQNRVSRLTDN